MTQLDTRLMQPVICGNHQHPRGARHARQSEPDPRRLLFRGVRLTRKWVWGCGCPGDAELVEYGTVTEVDLYGDNRHAAYSVIIAAPLSSAGAGVMTNSKPVFVPNDVVPSELRGAEWVATLPTDAPAPVDDQLAVKELLAPVSELVPLCSFPWTTVAGRHGHRCIQRGPHATHRCACNDQIRT